MNDSPTCAIGGSKKILVLEDTASVADLIQEMMLSFGHQVDVFATPNSALAALEVGNYDLVITDYMMPGMNGVEFAHIVRRRTPKQLIMLITGSAFSMSDGGSQQLPVNSILQKPFSVMEFQQAVAGLFTGEQTPATAQD